MPITRQGVYGQSKGNPLTLPCRVATTAAITLSGTQTIDAVAVVAGERVLVKDQASGLTNGIYIVAAGAWERAIDMSLTDDVYEGVQVYVNAGTTNGLKTFVLTTANPITLDTTALTFTVKDNGIVQVTGVTVLAASFSLVGGFYESSISNANILATSIVDVIPANASNEIVTAAQVLPETDSSAGAVKVYAKNLPTDTITITLNIIKNG